MNKTGPWNAKKFPGLYWKGIYSASQPTLKGNSTRPKAQTIADPCVPSPPVPPAQQPSAPPDLPALFGAKVQFSANITTTPAGPPWKETTYVDLVKRRAEGKCCRGQLLALLQLDLLMGRVRQGAPWSDGQVGGQSWSLAWPVANSKGHAYAQSETAI